MVRTTTERTVAQLTAILDAVPTAVIMIDEGGNIVLTNQQAERLFGYSEGELLGQKIDILVPQRFRAEHPALRAQFTRNPEARPMGTGRDLYGLHKSGSEFPIEIGLNPIQTDEGLFVVSAIVDISERKRMEARFRAMIESSPAAKLMSDRHGHIVLVNAEFERLFGYAREEVLGKSIEILIPERFRGSHPQMRANYLTENESRRMGAGRTLAAVHKDGREFPVEIGLSSIKMDQETFVLSTLVDISDRAQSRALQKAVEALERSNIELQRFAYIASHDLQTPLRSVVSFVELLQLGYADKFDEQGRDWMRRIVKSVKHLQQLIRDLLEYSRVDSQAERFDAVSMREVFDHVQMLLDTPLREATATLTSDELPAVVGDRSQLVQLMQNLISNGLKYRGAEPPRIHVSAERINHEWVFAVSDNGLGIAPQYHEQIFEIFQRLHDQREYPGTGIGLAICRRVVNRHGGRIWVQSVQGQGSKFYFSIPTEKKEAV